MNKFIKRYWSGIPPWIILGAVVILVPIFVFWTLQNINKQKENTTLLLLEKGEALIRSFEAGTRAGIRGMLGMPGTDFKLQRLLTETANQPGVLYISVTDNQGTIMAHSEPARIGETYGKDLDFEGIILSSQLEGRQVVSTEGGVTFEVFRKFSPRPRIPHPPPPLFDLRPIIIGGDDSEEKGSESDTCGNGPPIKGAEPSYLGQGAWFHGKGPPFKGKEPFGPGSGIYGPRYPGKRFDPDIRGDEPEQVIFVGLDMGPIEAARKEDTRNTVVMAFILLMIGFAGIVTLSLAQAYRSTKTSLTRIKAFSDNVVENMPIGLLTIDTEGKVASFNETAELLLRLPSTEVLGRKADEVLPMELFGLTYELDDEGIIEEDIDCTIEDGKVVPMEVIISPLEGDRDTFLGHVILFRDMTEVQNLKKEVERTQRLASLGRLAAGIAHEIRNPLSSIKGFATYFKERYKEIPEDRDTAQIMVREVERLNRVIGQLLEFARPMTIKKRPISMKTVIQHSLKMIEAQARDKNIKTSVKLSSDIKEISIDPDRINQVLLNLYLNAIEAMEEGGSLMVSLSKDGSFQRVKIVISDTGIGISKEDLVHIFDPYFTTKQSGTGLGLAIVHKIIESHRGEVRVESESGKGTTVTVILPAS